MKIGNFSIAKKTNQINAFQEIVSKYVYEIRALVAVIIPTYNRAQTLFTSVQSVLAQSYENIELIIVDDGSTDETAEKIMQLSDARVRYIRQENNSGACAARNRGIREAKGQFIALQDSDDIWHSDKLEKQMALLRSANADIVFCAMRQIYYNRRKTRHFPYLSNVSGLKDKQEIFEQLLSGNFISSQTILVKADVARQLPFDEDLPRMQDWDWALRASQLFSIRFFDEELVDAYIGKDSISSDPGRLIPALRIIYEKHRRQVEQNPQFALRYQQYEADLLYWTNVATPGMFWSVFLKTRKTKYLLKGFTVAFHLRGVVRWAIDKGL